MRIPGVVYYLFKVLLSFLQLALVALVVLIAYAAMYDFHPEKSRPLPVQPPDNTASDADSTFSFIIWNTGYGGLGEEMDFFYDGGSRTRPGKEEHQKYNRGINTFLENHDSVDFFLLQEVDKYSKRTYYYRQDSALRASLPGHYAVFSKNYDVRFVPMPVFRPMGRVQAGMMTFSKKKPHKAVREPLPQVHRWPLKYFMLDRAAVVTHYRLVTGKQLVVINIHNSAYVDDAEELQREIKVIKDVAAEETAKGNYVIIGGDWNQNPPGFSAEKGANLFSLDYQLSDTAIGKGWHWAYEAQQATNRSLATPYSDTSRRTLIDFYALSPGIEVQEVRVLSQDFKYSDHEPVYLRVELLNRQKNRR